MSKRIFLKVVIFFKKLYNKFDFKNLTGKSEDNLRNCFNKFELCWYEFRVLN